MSATRGLLLLVALLDSGRALAGPGVPPPSPVPPVPANAPARDARQRIVELRGEVAALRAQLAATTDPDQRALLAGQFWAKRRELRRLERGERRRARHPGGRR